MSRPRAHLLALAAVAALTACESTDPQAPEAIHLERSEARSFVPSGYVSDWTPPARLSSSPLPTFLAEAIVAGADLGGADLTPADGDVLSGSFTNVGTFTVPAGATVFVAPGADLSVTAAAVVIAGTLDGTGAGFAGGATAPSNQGDGLPGEGLGGGDPGLFGPNIHTPGGGGGGYGGPGGSGGRTLPDPPAAAGGPAYGSALPPGIQAGSGGGSAGNWQCCDPAFGGTGGAGGAAITLAAGAVTVTGAVLADGGDGGLGTLSPSFPAYRISGGGGGSGGGIWLDGALDLTGLVSASGGNGAAANGSTDTGWGTGGGGGGGGRIKLSGCTATNTATLLTSPGVAGGNSGVFTNPPTDFPTDGSGGSVSDESEPTCVIEVSLDIKPGGDPNSINLKSKGKGGNANVPVALLSGEGFDAADADLATLTLGDDAGDVVGILVKKNGSFQAALEDVDNDGDEDLVMHFSLSALIDSGDLNAASTQLCLNGTDSGGTPIHGCDAVRPIS